MRLLRVGPAGAERPAALLPDGRLVDISDLVPDIVPTTLAPETLQRLELELEERGSDLPRLEYGSVRIGSPVNGIGKIVCIGLNYHDHARETGPTVPSEPILFFKAADTVVGPRRHGAGPARQREDRLGGRARCRHRPRGALPRSPLRRRSRTSRGYAVANDVSEREFQMERGGPVGQGQELRDVQPAGAWLVTADEVPDPQALRLRLWVNGELQAGRRRPPSMIFAVGQVVWYISQFMALYPGDVINTGTPAGVALGRAQPKPFLRAGDVVELEIDGLGAQRQVFRSYADSRDDEAVQRHPEPAGGVA